MPVCIDHYPKAALCDWPQAPLVDELDGILAALQILHDAYRQRLERVK
jgi:hypothetical protein